MSLYVNIDTYQWNTFNKLHMKGYEHLAKKHFALFRTIFFLLHVYYLWFLIGDRMGSSAVGICLTRFYTSQSCICGLCSNPNVTSS